MSAPVVEEHVSVVEAARLLHVHPATIRRWINSGSLPAYRLGQRRIVIKRTDLARVITPTYSKQEKGIVASGSERPNIPRLSADEQQQALAAMEAARKLAAEIRARRNGELFSSSDVLINEARDLRTRDLA
jgi:excisionase family DNA binding protein